MQTDCYNRYTSQGTRQRREIVTETPFRSQFLYLVQHVVRPVKNWLVAKITTRILEPTQYRTLPEPKVLLIFT